MEFSEEKTILTRNGYDEIQRELNEILTVKRPALVDRIREARQLGDLSENFDYHDAKHIQAMMEARIKELKAIIAHATVVEAPANDGSVGIGSKVVVKDLEDGMEDEYTIVGPAESSPSEGKISNESAVGNALLGQTVGGVVSIRTPGGAFRFEVLSVQ
ncbi:MAG: transcription elongation factor GreA [Armatimonadetes bacterium]|nr:transcription elongation factor GreA [Armatimonadota bacterium]